MINIIGLKQYKKENASKICLGVFDGFHIGHQELMKQAEYLVTFYPHPKTILQNSNKSFNSIINYFTIFI